MFEADVKTFKVFAHEHDVDVFVAAARDQRARRTQIRVQLEFLSQADVDRSVAATDRGGQWPLQREPRATNAVEQRGRKRVAGLFNGRHSALLNVPHKRLAQRVENLDHGGGDFGPDTIAGNQGCGD